MPKNRLNSVNRLGTTMTARRMLGRGKRLIRTVSPRSRAVLGEQRGARANALPHGDAHRRPSGIRKEHVDPRPEPDHPEALSLARLDRKSTRLNSSHSQISYAVFCLKKKKNTKK